MLYDMAAMDKHFGSSIEADHNKAKRQHLDKTLPAGDKWSIQSALLCSLFPLFQLPESSKICFKTSPRHPFEKVSVAGPILAVKQVIFFSFHETYQNNVAFQKATNMTGAVSQTYAPPHNNKAAPVCLFLSGYL